MVPVSGDDLLRGAGIDSAPAAPVAVPTAVSGADLLKGAGLSLAPKGEASALTTTPTTSPSAVTTTPDSAAVPPDAPKSTGLTKRDLATTVGAGLGAAAGLAVPGFGEVGGPIVGAGAGGAAAGALYDWATGEPITAEHVAESGVGSAASEAVGGAVLRGAGKGAAALGRKVPAVGRTMEFLAPGVLKQGTRAKSTLAALRADDAPAVSALYAKVDELAGDQPVVPVAKLREALATIKGETIGTPRAMPSGVAKMERELPDVSAEFGASPELEDAINAASNQDTITFKQARVIESEFGRRARYRAPSRTPRDYYAGKLHEAIGDDLGTFFGSDAGAAVGPALQEAKDAYKVTLAQSKLKTILEKSTDPHGDFNAGQWGKRVLGQEKDLRSLLPADKAEQVLLMARDYAKFAPRRPDATSYIAKKAAWAVTGGLLGYPLYGAMHGQGLGETVPVELGVLGGAAALLSSPGRAMVRGLTPQLGGEAARLLKDFGSPP